MKKLIISLHFLMYHLCKGTIRSDDLTDALFFPACTRKHAIEPDEDDLREAPLVVSHPDHHAVVVCHLLVAERFGRVSWKPLEKTVGYVELAAFLSEHGLHVNPEVLARYRDRAYTHQGVRELCSGLPLEVVAWKRCE